MTNKTRGLIYLSVCEILLDYFDTTNYNTFNNFCIDLSLSLRNDKLPKKIGKLIDKLVNLLVEIYLFDFGEAVLFILEFLMLENLVIYAKLVRVNKLRFKFSSKF